MSRRYALVGLVWIVICLATGSQELPAAGLSQLTQEMLRKLNLDAAILADIDKELRLPGDWLEKAKKEGKVRINGTAPLRQSKILYGPFKERYPFIEVEHFDLSHEARLVKPLVAFKGGRIITDVLISMGGTYYAYKEANALEDLRDIPTVSLLSNDAKDKDGLWVGIQKNHYCMGYNLRQVKKDDLPKRWEDLLTNPFWRGGNLALTNRPQLWALMLWGSKGEEWVKDFLIKLFTDVKPQLRKEGVSASTELLAAGEFYGVLVATPGYLQQRAEAGAPVGFACPDVVPAAVVEAGILKGATNLYAARVFMNWFLSMEGQIALHFARDVAPARNELAGPQFVPFADQILGKRMSLRDPELEINVQPKLEKFWNQLWIGGGRLR